MPSDQLTHNYKLIIPLMSCSFSNKIQLKHSQFLDANFALKIKRLRRKSFPFSLQLVISVMSCISNRILLLGGLTCKFTLYTVDLRNVFILTEYYQAQPQLLNGNNSTSFVIKLDWTVTCHHVFILPDTSSSLKKTP